MKVSVYLGSSTTCLDIYNKLAFELGSRLAKNGHVLVYGGSDVGTMKYLADGAQSAGGYVIGAFPEGFSGTVEVKGKKVMREGLDEMIITTDFAERKKVMEAHGDCCIVMPGSFGTLDELFTYACRRSIGKHSKNIYILNHEGFYDPLIAMLENMDKAGFLKPSTVGILRFRNTLDEIFAELG